MAPIDQLTSLLSARYEIEREIGRGGMATVYLARDLRHQRLVALKVLDPELGAVLGAERFLSEIRVTANLQHPNLLPLFDSGEAAGLLFYVMPFVEGETLRVRLERERQLPIAESVRLATALAAALDYAHRHGVIHRDLKPENILLHDGQPLIADFGIALAVSNAGGQRITQTGLSLGTPQYMSPEQATGDRAIDGRTDIYSLGAVTYEMIAGEPPHTGSSAQAIIAKLMTEHPRSLTALRRSVPPAVDATVLRALEKLPADRFATAKEFADSLTDVRVPTVIAPATTRRHVMPWAIAAAALLVAGGLAFTRKSSASSDDAQVVRFPIALGPNERLAPVPGIPFAISDDDRTIAYVGQDSGAFRVLLRSLDKVQSRALPGSEGFQLSPTISPDGQWIALAKDGRIVKIPMAGGVASPVALPTVGVIAGMTWLADGTIVASVGGSLVAVPAGGGAWRTISTPDRTRDEVAQWGPRLLPDGKRLLYIAVSREGPASNRVATVPLAGGRQTITNYRGTTVLGALDGHAIWVTMAGAVAAAPIDGLSERATAEPIPLFEGVLVGAGGAAKAVMSRRGTLVYQSGQAKSQLMRVDRNGVGIPLSSEARAFRHPRFSPDGSRIAVTIRSPQSSDIWLYTIATRALLRLTSSGDNDFPEWFGDGTRIIYHSVQGDGRISIRWQAVDSNDGGVLVTATDDPAVAILTDDGKSAVFRRQGPTSRRGTLVLRDLASGATHDIIQSGFAEFTPRVSPDGQWLLYMTDESGTIQVMVAPLHGRGSRVAVSSDGGTEPQWSRDGRTIYYRNNRSFMSATFTPGTPATISNRTNVFASQYLADPTAPDYDVSRDGRFLMLQSVADEAQTMVVLGWEREVRAALKKP